MNEAALRALEVVQSEGVGDASELQRVVAGVKGAGVKDHHAVPAALHGDWLARNEGVPGGAGAEVGECGRECFVAFGVAQGEGVVVGRGFGEVERAGGGVGAVAGGEEGCYVGGLGGGE